MQTADRPRDTVTKADDRDRGPAVVVHLAPTPFFANRGCHIRIFNESEALRQVGVRVIVCTYGLGNDLPGVDTRRIPRLPGYNRTEAGFSPFKPIADILLFFLALKVVAQEKATVIHGHLHEGGLIGWCIKTALFWRRIDLVMDIQGSLSGELRAYGTFSRIPMLVRLFYYIERFVLLLPDQIICSSRASLEFLARECRVPREKLDLVGDVVPASFFATRNQVAQRARFGLPAEQKIVMYTGSLLPGKGIDVLLESIRLVAQSRNDVCFVLLGYPKERVAERVDHWECAHQLVLPGEVPYLQLADWLSTADVAVDPKGSGSGEASGKILHYMASGLSVVCFATDNNRRFLGSQGFFAAAETATDLARAIELALTDEQARQSYGVSGRDRAARKFGVAAVGRQLRDIYRRVR